MNKKMLYELMAKVMAIFDPHTSKTPQAILMELES